MRTYHGDEFLMSEMYETLQDHQEKIQKLTKEVHDKDMLTDEMERRIGELEHLKDEVSNLQQEVDMIKFRERRR